MAAGAKTVESPQETTPLVGGGSDAAPGANSGSPDEVDPHYNSSNASHGANGANDADTSEVPQPYRAEGEVPPATQASQLTRAVSREPSGDEVVIPKNIWLIISSLWLGSFLSAADTTIVSTTANTIASSMNGADNLTYIATAYLLTNAIFQPLVGRISDIYGRRTTLIVAQFWFALGCLLCSTSKTVKDFTIARAVAGIGGGGMSALSSIIVTDVIPLRMRGMFQGYANLVYGTGQFVGPVIGSAFLSWNETSGWRWMFGLQVPLVLIAGLLVDRNVHDFTFDAERRIKHRWDLSNLSKVDLPGSLTLAIFISAIISMFSTTSSKAVQISFLISIVSAVAFWLVEKYVVSEHIIPPSAFQGVLRIAAFVAAFGAMAVYGMNYLLPVYIQVVQDFSSYQVGVFNSFGVFASALGSLLAGWLLKDDKKTRNDIVVKKAINVSIGACACLFVGEFLCMFLVRTIPTTIQRVDIDYTKMGLLCFGFVLSSIGYGGFLVSLLILVVGEVGIRHQASVTGMNYMFRSLGSVSGVGISLGVYNMILYKELSEYFAKKKNGNTLLAQLLKSTFFIREGGLPARYIPKVLKKYRDAAADSTIMIFIMASMALLLSVLLKLYTPSALARRQQRVAGSV